MQLRLGINNCFAVKRWPRPADWGPIVRDRLGLRLVEHSLDLVDLTADEPAALRQEVAAEGLELNSVFTGLAAYSSNLLLHPSADTRAAAEAWYRAAIDWTARAGGRSVGGHVGAYSVADWTDPITRRERWSDLRRSLEGLAEAARTAGLDQLLVENLAAAREPSTMPMIRELVTAGDDRHVPIRLCLDVGHMCVPGATGPERDPYAWLSTMGPLAAEVQLQQSDADGDHHWPFTRARNAAGRIDVNRTIDALAEGGVETCTLLLEVIPAFEQPDDEVLADLAESVDYWREALDRRGVLASQA